MKPALPRCRELVVLVALSSSCLNAVPAHAGLCHQGLPLIPAPRVKPAHGVGGMDRRETPMT